MLLSIGGDTNGGRNKTLELSYIEVNKVLLNPEVMLSINH